MPAGSYRVLDCQELTLHEEPLQEPVESVEPSSNSFRCRLALATLGMTFLALAAIALHGMPGAVSCTELLPSNRQPALAPTAAWAGRLKGPVERKLQANSVGDAIAILQRATKVAQEIQEEVLRLRTALAREAEPRVSVKRKRRRAEAICVLQSLAISEQIIKIATNLKASVDVCAEDPLFKMLQGRFGRLVRGLKKWICVINIELVIIGFFSIASGLANAAVTCSVASNSSSSLNMAQQVDASCTQAGLVLSQSLVTLAASLQITIPGCQILTLGLEKQLTSGLASLGSSAATFGSHTLGDMSPSERSEIIKRLESSLTPDNFGSASIANLVDPAGASAAGMGPDGADGTTARRLFLGGGPEVFMTNCVVDVLQALTALGLIGTTLDTIVNADCRDPFVGPVTSQAVPKFLRDRVENGLRAGCASGISNILAKLGIATLFLSFTSFHCTNKANLRAICGAGIAGIEASLAGLASAGAGAYLACTEGQRKTQTKILIKKSRTAFVEEKSQEVLDEYCPDLSVECFLEFKPFLGNCPNGVVTSTCPAAPSESSCPGVASCVTEFESYRAANLGTPWFPTPAVYPLQFGKLVVAVPACWEYLDCFSPGRRLGATNGSTGTPVPDSSEKLQSHARRSFLLQKIFASDAWSATTSARSRRSGGGLGASPGGAGMELVEQLFASMGRNLTPPEGRERRTPRVERSQSLLDANLLGEDLLNQASQQWQQHKSEEAGDRTCDAPLLEESDTTIP
mmetsp:Transcript_39584/g.85519  ORF Transcript_39584/g.85519 Transcript_39584/m.85519 type:complete len:747 (+) Transcript_39584:59-2299(+)